jgi:hypothetical protein
MSLQRAQLPTRRHVYLPPWPPWKMATTLTCTLIVWTWGPHPGPTWSPLGLCALAMQPGNPRWLRTWTAPRWGTPTTEVEAHTVANHYYLVATTLVRNLIWPYNNCMLNHYTRSFLVSPSLASKPMMHRLSLCLMRSQVGSTLWSCRKLGLRARSWLPTLERGRGLC